MEHHEKIIPCGSIMYRYHAFMAQITDKMAQDAHIYGYSMEEAYKFFYGTAIKTGPPRNRFQNIRHLADDTEHPGINNDMHLQGRPALSVEPVIVSMPGMDNGRCWILHPLDMGHYTTSMSG
ncbi:hypothetical protein [Aeromonas caviae]|uniref:hypothetical protein n=1 Tax=Aeromonas caviae TaxID=648 RepID=UPI000A9F08AE|nr:hypothetical protein [Aeromonas caviae]